jgi:hypothetical protein
MSPTMNGVRTRRVCLGALQLLLAGTASARAQYVRLRVTNDAADDAPVPRAQVILLNDRSAWQTDDQGVIVLRPQHPGANIFTIRHLGLAPITTTLNVREHDTLKVHIVMNSAPQLLDTVSIRALASTSKSLSPFDERKLHNAGGHFITWIDIQHQRPVETSDLFRRVLGLRVIRSGFGTMIEATRGGGAAFRPCLPRVGFDGMVFGTTRDFNVDDIAPSEIHGIEIYNGAASVPGQFMTATAGGACGLIMIWTADGARQSTRQP